MIKQMKLLKESVLSRYEIGLDISMKSGDFCF